MKKYWYHGRKPGASQARSDLPCPMVMQPITERVSPIDGTVITDRGQLKEHNRRNNVVDIGDTVLEKNTPKTSKREYRNQVGEAYRKVKAGYAPKEQKASDLDGKKVETRIIGEA